MLGHRLRRWPNINPAFIERLVFAGARLTTIYIWNQRNTSHVKRVRAYWSAALPVFYNPRSMSCVAVSSRLWSGRDKEKRAIFWLKGHLWDQSILELLVSLHSVHELSAILFCKAKRQ